MTINFDPIELDAFMETLHMYERVTGLVEYKMTHDQHSLWIEWAYNDGSWAGVTSFNMPLIVAVEKLEAELAHERQMLREGHCRLSGRLTGNNATPVEVELVELYEKVS